MPKAFCLFFLLILISALQACGGQGAGLPYGGYIDPYFQKGYYGSPSRTYNGPNYYMDSEGRLYHPYGYDYPYAPYFFKQPELPPAQSEMEEESDAGGNAEPENRE